MDNAYHGSKYHLIFNTQILQNIRPTRHTSIISVQVKNKSRKQKGKILISSFDNQRKSLASISLPNSQISLKKNYSNANCMQVPFIKRLSDKAAKSIWSNIALNQLHSKSINRVKLVPLLIPNKLSTSVLSIKSILMPKISRNTDNDNSTYITHQKVSKCHWCLKPNIVRKCNEVLSLLRKSRMHNQIY